MKRREKITVSARFALEYAKIGQMSASLLHYLSRDSSISCEATVLRLMYKALQGDTHKLSL